jgi:hypothetical protein
MENAGWSFYVQSIGSALDRMKGIQGAVPLQVAILVVKSPFFSLLTLPLSPTGEGIRGKNFWQSVWLD